MSGLAFAYKPEAPPGKRVTEVTVGGEPLNPERVYAVATNDFLAAGGDGFEVLAAALAQGGVQSVGGLLRSEQLVYNDSATWMRDVVIEDLKAKGKVAPRVEGRIREVH